MARVVTAQQIPLAEVARREAERRKAIPAAAKVLTNKDLPKSLTPAPVAAPAAGNPAAAATPVTQIAPVTEITPVVETTLPEPVAAAPGGATDPPKDEAWWRARVDKARDALARDEVLTDALQSRVNALAADFVARDDPYQRARLGEDRQKALAEMARMQGEITLLKQTIDDIEEEARKANVPPGWLR